MAVACNGSGTCVRCRGRGRLLVPRRVNSSGALDCPDCARSGLCQCVVCVTGRIQNKLAQHVVVEDGMWASSEPAAPDAKCDECKGKGYIELAISRVECRPCTGTGRRAPDGVGESVLHAFAHGPFKIVAVPVYCTRCGHPPSDHFTSGGCSEPGCDCTRSESEAQRP